jgi:segregation and condensation protein B
VSDLRFAPDEAEIERRVEALLFAAAGPLSAGDIARRLPEGADVGRAIAALRERYQNRGVELECVADRWRFRTAADLSFMMTEEREEPRRLSKAALETLAIIAYHQPVTRAEIESVRGVSISKGTLDLLLEMGFVRLRGPPTAFWSISGWPACTTCRASRR